MYYIGVDLGGTGAQAGIVNEKGEILYKGSVPTRAHDGYEAVVKDMAALVLNLVKDSGISMEEIDSIGIGCPGSIDDKNGVVTYSNNIDMKNAPVCAEMQKYINKPVYIGNDANCAALGEFFALNDDTIEDFVAITLGTGVGGGVIINKKLYTGYNGVAGELGHIQLCLDGAQCSCGRKGCWEAYASATALVRDTEEAAKKNPDSLVAQMVAENGGNGSGKTAFTAAKQGDAVGKQLVENYVKYVGEGLIDIINIFQPNVIAIGGGISKEGDNLLMPVREYVSGKTYGAGLVSPVKITIAKLGNDAGIIGAAFLGR